MRPPLTVIDRLERQNVPFQLVHFESSAAIMAGIATRLGAGIGVALSIKGPGLANMATAVAAAKTDSSPVLVLSG